MRILSTTAQTHDDATDGSTAGRPRQHWTSSIPCHWNRLLWTNERAHQPIICEALGRDIYIMSCRAVHLELSHSLNTDSFLAAFSRFTSRQGTPRTVYSDNGTNLTSAEKELRELIEQLEEGLFQFSPSIREHFSHQPTSGRPLTSDTPLSDQIPPYP